MTDIIENALGALRSNRNHAIAEQARKLLQDQSRTVKSGKIVGYSNGKAKALLLGGSSTVEINSLSSGSIPSTVTISVAKRIASGHWMSRG